MEFFNRNHELAIGWRWSFAEFSELSSVEHVKGTHFLVNGQLIFGLRRTNIGVVAGGSQSTPEDHSEVQPTNRLVLSYQNLQSSFLFRPHRD